MRYLAASLFLFGSWSVSFDARAAEGPPVYLPGNVNGVLLVGPLDRKPFSFTPAIPADCERTEVLKMVVYRCKGSGGRIQIGEAGPKVDFTGVTVFYKTMKTGEVLREYHFQGTWTENVAGAERSTAARWVLYRANDAAPEYLGFLELGWGYSVRLVAAAP
jgi:hypothetical protein